MEQSVISAKSRMPFSPLLLTSLCSISVLGLLNAAGDVEDGGARLARSPPALAAHSSSFLPLSLHGEIQTICRNQTFPFVSKCLPSASEEMLFPHWIVDSYLP